MLGEDFGSGQVFYSILWFTLFFIWIWLLIIVFSDIFRSHDMGGFAKAIWVLFVIILPYLAFSAMLMAGLDGIQNRTEPIAPVDRDLYDLPPEELAKVPQVPGSLDAALAALEADHAFLKVGGVFTDDLIETWIRYKREVEIDAVRLRPHPYEFALYYDI